MFSGNSNISCFDLFVETLCTRQSYSFYVKCNFHNPAWFIKITQIRAQPLETNILCSFSHKSTNYQQIPRQIYTQVGELSFLFDISVYLCTNDNMAKGWPLSNQYTVRFHYINMGPFRPVPSFNSLFCLKLVQIPTHTKCPLLGEITFLEHQGVDYWFFQEIL